MGIPNKTTNNTFRKGGNNPKPVITLSNDYRACVNSGYYMEGGNGLSSIKKELVVDYAVEIANKFAQAKVTSTQIRSFYDAVKQVETRADITSLDYDQLMEDIYPLLAVVRLKCEKETLPVVFEEFLKLNISNINNKRDIKAFEKHFKTILCYMPQKKK